VGFDILAREALARLRTEADVDSALREFVAENRKLFSDGRPKPKRLRCDMLEKLTASDTACNPQSFGACEEYNALSTE
jgi:hypothetical protein